MLDRAFIDTNILIYLYTSDEPDKRSVAHDVFRCYTEPVVSVPVLNELCKILLKKFGDTAGHVKGVVQELSNAALVATISENTTLKAVDFHEKYKLAFFDCFHLATAVENACSVFFSEDLQHGQKIETLKIVNPFNNRL